MRIALVTPEHPLCGPSFGVGSYVATLATALAAAGGDVLIVACTAAGRFTFAPGATPRRHAGGTGPAITRPAWCAIWLSQVLSHWRPQVVEYASWGGLGACDRGQWLRAVRLVTPVAAIPAEDALRRALRPLHQRWEERTVSRSHLVIADSAAMARLGKRVHGREADTIIPLAFAGEMLPPVADGDEALFVGRLEPRKGVDILLAAWREVRRARPSALLHLVGPDRNGFGARSLAEHGGDGVIVHGWLNATTLTRLRSQCRVQVVPSRFESFGLVVLEAWAGGQAVVASTAGALPEVVGDAGELSAPDDAPALARSIERLFADAGGCAKLAAAGQARLREHFAPSACAEATLAAYRASLERRTWQPALATPLRKGY